MKKTTAFLLVGMMAITAQASQDQTIHLSRGESCMKSADLDLGGGEEYTKSDRRAIDKLCSYDMHITKAEENGQGKAVGTCAKLNSTFPAVEFIKIPKNGTKADIRCNKKVGAKNSGKVAKYKYSTSCANSSSIIGYYHVSRALGIKFVPQAVLRTMDLKSHIAFAQDAVNTVGGDGNLISKNWRTLLKGLKNKNPKYVSDDGQMSWGILAVNPKGEQKTYDGVWLGGDGQGQRLTNFMSSSKSTYKKLIQRKPVTEIVGIELSDRNYTAIQQMKDVADMIILDTIFGQKDRFANTHSLYTWMIVNPDGSLKKLSFKDVEGMIEDEVDAGVAGAADLLDRLEAAKDMPKDWRKQITARLSKIRGIVDGYLSGKGYQFAFAENLMLKDNDCGLMDSNPFARRDVIGDVYHVSPETFEQLMKLQDRVNSGALDNFISENLAMNSADMKKFKDGLNHVANDLRAKDNAGQLYKDLEVKAHFKVTPRETTPEGYPIYDINPDKDMNIRRSLVQGDPTDLNTETEVIQYKSGNLTSQKLSKLAVIKWLKVGKYDFIKAIVLEGEDQVGQTIYTSARSIR